MQQSEAGWSAAGTQVLVLGLDGAGKTSLLHCFSTGCLEQDVQPTEGFNAVSISREDLRIEFLESESDLKRRDSLSFFFKSVTSWTSVYLSVCQLEAKRRCGPTGGGTCPRPCCWCSWSIPPTRRFSPSLSSICTSCWRPRLVCL